jgi:hypothetical protein
MHKTAAAYWQTHKTAEGTKQHKAQNGRRHKTAEDTKRQKAQNGTYCNSGNPLLIKAGGINKSEKILVLCTHNDLVGWHCHHLISMDQEKIPLMEY